MMNLIRVFIHHEMNFKELFFILCQKEYIEIVDLLIMFKKEQQKVTRNDYIEIL